ncbi:MAG: hypothetical protein LW847_08215 [Burkholderiales bacterium]|jgi:hypothetical protein|nr:hypothetical protein [Burkholderiales bacterium]
MRRVLIILLACVLPLKAAAAMVVPIVGAPAAFAAVAPHAADAHAGHTAAHDTTAADEAPCCCDDGARDLMHDHGCPHLAMAVVAPGAVALPTAPATPQLARHASRSGPSVVLDVPCPPPNA